MTLKEIKNAVLLCCPEWIIESISYLGEGEFCAAYVINGQWIFRFAKNRKARKLLKREYCLLPKLARKISLPIPSPQFIYREDKDNHSFIIYPLLPGKTLSQKRYLALNDADRRACAEQTADFLNELHLIEVKFAEDCGVAANDYVGIYADLLRQAQDDLFPVLAQPEREFVERVIENYLESGNTSNYRPTLLHGDLSPGHIIFDKKEKRVSGIIDFGDVMIGDPAWDFVRIYEDYGLDFLSKMLPAYNQPDKTDLLRRVFQFTQMEAVEWAINCQPEGGDDFAEAVRQIQTLRTRENIQLKKLLLISESIRNFV